MKKIVMIIVMLTMILIVKAQEIMVLNVEGTCRNWSKEIYDIVKNDTVTEYQLKNGLYIIQIKAEEKTVNIGFDKKKLVIDDVSFDINIEQFKKSEKEFVPDHSYFETLRSVRGAVYDKIVDRKK